MELIGAFVGLVFFFAVLYVVIVVFSVLGGILDTYFPKRKDRSK